jgi:transcriptional regulator with XRE-family HTH domain
MNIRNLEGVLMNKVPSPTEDLIEELKDPEFKKEYGAEQAKLEFAVVLHDARTQARLTQQQLAGLLGRSQPYIARLEGGEANPTLAAIGRMLAALDLRIVIETVPIKPELGAVFAAAWVAAGVIPDVMLVNASGDVVYAADIKSLHRRKAEDWISVTGFEPTATASPVLAVAATV